MKCYYLILKKELIFKILIYFYLIILIYKELLFNNFNYIFKLINNEINIFLLKKLKIFF